MGEASAEVRYVTRVDGVIGGSDSLVVEGMVSARAMLQALAPRSRIVGKCLFMS